MKKRIFVLLAVLLFCAACAPKTGIEVRDAWMNPASQGATGGVYLTIHNYDKTDDALVGVSAEVSQAAEIHESKLENDVMRMRMVESAALPAGKSVEFAPGGWHIMLVNLARPLADGDTIEIVLHFQQHADILVSVMVHTNASEHEGH
ncbi:MAG: hypothetical protein HKUEN02_20500 [Anaerolineaceae bacterium]|nr:MAG: hypothetical protein HKUEN02_20500 [Anaerolineaceae bacterium]